MAPNATPTEIILAQTTPSDGGETVTPSLPPAGIATFGKIFAVVAAAVILIGLLL